MMENPASNNPLINQLPDECLRHIFTFLPISERLKVEQVCKRWRIIGEEGWNDIKKLDINCTYSKDIIHLILKRCVALKVLFIPTSTKRLNYLSMVKEFGRLDQLQGIVISSDEEDYEEVELNIRNLREIFKRTTKLVTVRIKGTNIFNKMDYLYFLNPKTLRTLSLVNQNKGPSPYINLDRFPNLESLLLLKFTITGDEMEREEKSLEKLEKINVARCFIPKSIIHRIRTMENLRELSLGCNYCNITNEDVRSIAKHCRRMKKMSLTCSPSMTSDCFQYLGEIVSLEDLEFQLFAGVKTQDIACLTNVKKLCFAFCMGNFESDGCIKLITNPSNLETLKLLGIDNLKVTFVNNVLQVFRCGQRVKPLRLELMLAADQEHLHAAMEKNNHPLLDLSISFQ